MRTLWFIGSSGAIVGLAVAAGWGGIAATALTVVVLVIGRALLLRKFKGTALRPPGANTREAAGSLAPKRGWHRDDRDNQLERWSNGASWTHFERPVGERKPRFRARLGQPAAEWRRDVTKTDQVQRWWDGQSWTRHRRPATTAFLDKPGALGRARVAVIGILVAAVVTSQVVVADGAARADERGSIVRVVDGDTVDVRVDGTTQRVRLLNIDTPETVAPGRPVECLGPEATALTKSILPAGAAVVLRFDGERRDDYGRTLAAVSTSDGRNVSEELAVAGLGSPVDLGHHRFLDDVQAASEIAASRESGLFDQGVECTAPGSVQALRVTAISALATPAPDAPIARLEAAAARATTFLKGVEAVDPSTSTLWRLYSRAQQKTLQAAFDGLRDQARQVQSRPSERRASIALEKAEAREKAERAVAAEKVAQKKAAARAAAAKKAAEKRAAARRAAAARAAAAAREQQGSSSGSGGSGYTGCRQYAPGGKTWKPIPCPRR